MRVARDYGCLIEDKGITFRASYLIDPLGVLRYAFRVSSYMRWLTVS
jgi:alkyl hydroperoxide reductase subunit AhpC